MDDVARYLEPVDDGLPMREAGKWTLRKLFFVRRYLSMVTTSMRDKGFCSLNYLDLFSGPGKCRIEESGQVALGSALISLTLPYPFTRYWFSDLDATNAEAVRERCTASPLVPSIEVRQGDANLLAPQIAKEIRSLDRTRGSHMPCLSVAFLDPEAFELKWTTVATLASLPKMDLILYYPQSAITRWGSILVDREDVTDADEYMGGQDWRAIYRNWQRSGAASGRLHRALLDHLREKLRNMGYVDFLEEEWGDTEPLMRNTEKNAPLYRLLFASKNYLGNKLWREATSRDVDGQRRLPL
jgi:three-Cys-motif partner protein